MIVGKKATVENDRQIVSPLPSRRVERVKGIEPSYSESPDFRNIFQGLLRHFAAFWAIEITQEFLFVGMAVERELARCFSRARCAPAAFSIG